MESLLITGKRVQRTQSTTLWEQDVRSNHTLELYLRDSLEIPIGIGFNGGPGKLHNPLSNGDCRFIYDRRTCQHEYMMRARINLDGDISNYEFSLLFSRDTDHPTYGAYELEKGYRVRIPIQYHERAMWVGDRLFWALNSESGILACKGIEHSPTQLFDIWWGMVMHSFIPKED